MKENAPDSAQPKIIPIKKAKKFYKRIYPWVFFGQSNDRNQ
jgi:hypothetical protein